MGDTDTGKAAEDRRTPRRFASIGTPEDPAGFGVLPSCRFGRWSSDGGGINTPLLST